MVDFREHLKEDIHEQLKSINSVIKSDYFSDYERLVMLALLSNEICVHCGSALRRNVCFCTRDD